MISATFVFIEVKSDWTHPETIKGMFETTFPPLNVAQLNSQKVDGNPECYLGTRGVPFNDQKKRIFADCG